MNGQIGNSVNQIDSESKKSQSILYACVQKFLIKQGLKGPHKMSQYSSV